MANGKSTNEDNTAAAPAKSRFVRINIQAGDESNPAEPFLDLHCTYRRLPDEAAQIIEFGTVEGAMNAIKRAAGFSS